MSNSRKDKMLEYQMKIKKKLNAICHITYIFGFMVLKRIFKDLKDAQQMHV